MVGLLGAERARGYSDRLGHTLVCSARMRPVCMQGRRGTHVGGVFPCNGEKGVAPRDGMPDLDDFQRVFVGVVLDLHIGEVCVRAPRTILASPFCRPSRSAAARLAPSTAPCRSRPTGTTRVVSARLIGFHTIVITLATARSAIPIVIPGRWASPVSCLGHIIACLVVVLVADREDVLVPPTVLLDNGPPAPYTLHARARPEIATSETRVVLPQSGITAQAPLAHWLEAARGVVR